MKDKDPSLKRCKVCGAQVRSDRLDAHIRKVHSAPAALKSSPKPQPTREIFTPPPPPSNRRIFVSYARPDVSIVGHLVRFLDSAGFETWFDLHDLHAGEDWRFIINREIERARLFLLCLSSNSVDRTGYCQKELRLSLEQAELRPPGEVFIMPLRLNPCATPSVVARWHVLDLFTPDATDRFLEAIQSATNEGARAPREEHSKLTQAIQNYNETNAA